MASINYLGLAQGLVMLGSGYWVYSQAQTGQLPCDIQNWLRKQFPSLPACTTGDTNPPAGDPPSSGGGGTNPPPIDPPTTPLGEGFRDLGFMSAMYNTSSDSIYMTVQFQYRGPTRYYTLHAQAEAPIYLGPWQADKKICYVYEETFEMAYTSDWQWQSYSIVVPSNFDVWCYTEGKGGTYDILLEIKEYGSNYKLAQARFDSVLQI